VFSKTTKAIGEEIRLSLDKRDKWQIRVSQAMNQINVAGMNPGAGGPVGGIPMMNSGSSAPRGDPNANVQDSMVVRLNTYIYDYFLKRGYHDCARALVQDESIPINTSPASKSAPGHRRDGDVNGVDPDGMLADSKEDIKSRIPDDLPRPNLNGDPQQTSFLFDWFNLFWDIFWAQRKRGKSDDVMQYIQHTQVWEEHTLFTDARDGQLY
jgi:hypothetical protein